MEDVMLKREAATEFFQRDRRNLRHECYTECCEWEEVRENFGNDRKRAVRLTSGPWQWAGFQSRISANLG
jgi:hypothetical protein